VPALERLERCVIEPVLAGLDVVRSRILKTSAPITGRFVRDRDRRVVAAAVFACCTALFASVGATGWVLLFGPLVFGMPHLVAEARYLFFQPHRRNTALFAVLALQTVLVFAGLGIHGLGISTALALFCVGGCSRANLWLFALALVMFAAALVAPTWSRFALLHGHNFVPLFVWLVWRERPKATSLLVTAILCAAVGAILVGAFDRVAIHTPLSDDTFSLTRITDAVAGEFAGPWRKRFLVLFCFMQSVHYAFWLRLVPEEARDRETPRTWRASWRAYKTDAGPALARLAMLAILVVPLFALALGPVRARSFYVTASEFHATVETVLVLLLLRRRA
jgi:hypothetical protein